MNENTREQIPDLGEPISIHPPAKWLRNVDLLKDVERVVPCALAVLFVGLSGYFVWLHQTGRLPVDCRPSCRRW